MKGKKSAGLLSSLFCSLALCPRSSGRTPSRSSWLFIRRIVARLPPRIIPAAVIFTRAVAPQWAPRLLAISLRNRSRARLRVHAPPASSRGSRLCHYHCSKSLSRASCESPASPGRVYQFYRGAAAHSVSPPIMDRTKDSARGSNGRATRGYRCAPGAIPGFSSLSKCTFSAGRPKLE